MEENQRLPVKPDGWAITVTNEHPEETIKYFDFWFTDLGKRLSNFGVEGQQYDLVDGKENAIDLTGVAVSMDGIEVQDREFVDAVRDGREPNASVAQCLPAMQTLDRLARCL